MSEKAYILNIYNTMTGEFELVQVTKEVFQTYRRTKWHIEDSTERFYKHETQMSSLIGGENDGYERFHEFIDYDNTPENQAIEEMVRQSLRNILDLLPPKDYELIYELYFKNRSEKEYAQMLGVSQQAIHVRKDQMEALLEAFAKAGAYVLPDDKAPELAKILFKENGMTDPAHVGMRPCKLAELMGLTIPANTSILLFRSLGMTRENLLRREKLCPVVQVFPFDTFEEGIANAKCNLEWEGDGHSAVVYTDDTKKAEYAGLHLPVSRVVVNQPGGAASGGNFINGLHPTMSLGCGSWGNNSISDNLSYKHLMNTTKLAFYHDPTIPSAEKVWEE